MLPKKKKVEKLLGEILVENDIITAQQLNDALSRQREQGGLIGEIIVKLDYATEEEITQCISFQYGFPYIPLENYDIPKELTSLVPKEIVKSYCFLPIDKVADTLIIAMANPLNTEAISHLERITSLSVQIFISTPSDIRNAINGCYGGGEAF